MKKFLLKRTLLVIPTMIGIIFIIFAIMSFTPGDPGRIILGQAASPEAVDNLNRELGFDKPFMARFFNYLADIVRGDFGTSYRTGRPVFDSIFERFPTTFKLAVGGMILAIFIGIPLGILSAVKQYSAMDIAGTVSAMFMASIPGFWLGLMVIILFSLWLGWLPSNGIGSFKHYILPALTVAIPEAAYLLRLTRTTMLEIIRADYIRTARAKGVPERTVIWKHALRNTLLPIITVLAMGFARALGGTVLVEAVFSMPGLGTLVLTSIRTKDVPQVMAAVILLSFLFMFIMLLVDVMYGFIDPRTRSLYRKE